MTQYHCLWSDCVKISNTSTPIALSISVSGGDKHKRSGPTNCNAQYVQRFQSTLQRSLKPRHTIHKILRAI